MFAIAAIAAASFSITPAFADATADFDVYVDAYDTDNYNIAASDCGGKAVFTYLQVSEHSPGTEDLVRVNTDASRWSGSVSVTVTIDKNGTEVLNQTKHTTLAEFTYPGPLVGGDHIEVTAQYYC